MSADPAKALPDPSSMLDAFGEFYSADAEALRAKYRQLEKLIGLSHHSASEGDYCETLLKELLRRALPRRVSIDSGFIRRIDDTDWTKTGTGPHVLAATSPIASPQLDIIVHDSTDFAPLFRTEDLVVVVPEAVKAIIEVKKTLTWKSLQEGVDNISETRDLLRHWRHESYRVFSCVFAFDVDDELIPQSKNVSNSFETCYRKTVNKYGVCEAPDLLISLSGLALQRQDNNPIQFFYCPTAPDGVSIAVQVLLFILAYRAIPATQRNIPFPLCLHTREMLFEIPWPSQ